MQRNADFCEEKEKEKKNEEKYNIMSIVYRLSAV
jgi:hypothetical protein